MTLEQFHALQSERGCELLARLAREALSGDDLLPVLKRYRAEYPAELVSAGVELTRLREKGMGKFSRAAEMFFTPDGLQMASSEPVARHTAGRFAGLPLVLDLCCGIGADTLALAEASRCVVAVDRDPLALEMARANARALGLEGCSHFVNADVVEFAIRAPLLLGAPAAVFIDPSRREARAAARRPEAYSPPISWCLSLLQLAPRVAIKTSPALDFEHALTGTAAEVEVISLHGECKEAMLWLGDFRTCARRATLLPSGVSLTEEGPSSDALGDIGAWIYEPDPAIIRAGLLRRLAGELGLRRIDAEIAYLSGDSEIASPFVTGYQVQEVIPWGLKRMNEALAARKISRVTIKKRGFPLTPDELQKKLKLTGKGKGVDATLICTRAQGKPVVIIAERS
ncbi:MAG: THUMP-like domain-containing protein [Armatimonadota bacterium]